MNRKVVYTIIDFQEVRLKGSQKMQMWYSITALFLLLLDDAKLNFISKHFHEMKYVVYSSISLVKSLSISAFIDTFVPDFK